MNGYTGCRATTFNIDNNNHQGHKVISVVSYSEMGVPTDYPMVYLWSDANYGRAIEYARALVDDGKASECSIYLPGLAPLMKVMSGGRIGTAKEFC